MNLKRYLWAFLALLIALPGTQHAQSPEKDPFDIPVLTLSKGKYEEFHDQDTVVKIGHVLFNVHTGHIVGFIEQDTMHGDDAFQADIATRWLSPDPLAEEFPSWSPFTYVEDNPIVLVDPDGRAARLAIGGPTTRTWIPATKRELYSIALSQGLDRRTGGVGGAFNRMIGQGFERSILELGGITPNKGKFPAPSRKRHQNVVPDYVSNRTTNRLTIDLVALSFETEKKITQNGQMFEVLDNSHTNFGEIKTSPVLNLSTNDYQLAGMIDALGNQSIFSEDGSDLGSVNELGGGVLYLTTTADTKVGTSLLNYASSKGVTVFQSEMYLDPDDSNRSSFRITVPRQLNEEFDNGSYAKYLKNWDKVNGKQDSGFLPGKGKLEF